MERKYIVTFLAPKRSIPRAILLVIFAAIVGRADVRLVLKDGTDQRVRSYEVIGDRVRYYSTERSAWEEVPVELVDWEATEQAKRDAQRPLNEPQEQAPAATRTVAPGVVLPEAEGVYVFDGRVVQPLQQVRATVENDRTRNLLTVLSPVPVLKGRAWIRLPESRASRTVTVRNPIFYVQLQPISPAGYVLVRLEPSDKGRIVAEIRITPLTGKLAESRHLVPTTWELAFPAEDSDQPSVWRLTPAEPLAAGEYAVVELVEKEKQNLFVWDFRIDLPQP